LRFIYEWILSNEAAACAKPGATRSDTVRSPASRPRSASQELYLLAISAFHSAVRFRMTI
jgi:hypothetical protein